jgi:hypothetical protein
MSKVKTKKPFYKRISFWVIAVLAIGIIGSIGESEDTEQATTTEEKATATSDTNTNTDTESKESEKPAAKKEKKDDSKDKKTINYEEFQQIQNGMSYEEVVEIIGGAEGELNQESGTKGDQFYMATYGWDGEDGWGDNAVISFDGNGVTSKTQLGLDQ